MRRWDLSRLCWVGAAIPKIPNWGCWENVVFSSFDDLEFGQQNHQLGEQYWASEHLHCWPNHSLGISVTANADWGKTVLLDTRAQFLVLNGTKDRVSGPPVAEYRWLTLQTSEAVGRFNQGRGWSEPQLGRQLRIRSTPSVFKARLSAQLVWRVLTAEFGPSTGEGRWRAAPEPKQRRM